MGHDLNSTTDPKQPELRLNWAVEFDEPAGTRADARYFGNDIGDGVAAGIPGWGNSEREWYLAEAAATDGQGNLVVSADRTHPESDPVAAAREAYYGGPAEWTSAKLTTLDRVHFMYGRIEARLQSPTGLGTWPKAASVER